MTFRKVLVTGSSGTIGTRLCERLMEDGAYEVIG
ncbi:MAG: NAD-dependent epimerase/dehydratase family protein, partial [Gammaproteobacteria bacterium]|nr:NAD-dependent epimerase/dehydratase family protein [Gammaproteobacteria bacterium]NIR98129.1 NAD-dependent epimerase/dehydratase family protein [Gammaproteobacteria bacterium]NIT63820.1 NAD-dependent epimerase/dehydratase family protein [Gammaproteobacteria bacterium]NIV20773.1 NAD-dependent epimerase/dehydratase family protein [Gammaproteobacteria bacterium]NIY32400.1 NAD-dependent epimerase/dehydratase family protein [Gammaproteobacteria bacterium]